MFYCFKAGGSSFVRGTCTCEVLRVLLSEEGGPSEVFVNTGTGEGKLLRIEGVVNGQEFMKTSLSSFKIATFRDLCRLRNNTRIGG